MQKSHKHDIELKKPDVMGYLLYGSIYNDIQKQTTNWWWWKPD